MFGFIDHEMYFVLSRFCSLERWGSQGDEDRTDDRYQRSLTDGTQSFRGVSGEEDDPNITFSELTYVASWSKSKLYERTLVFTS